MLGIARAYGVGLLCFGALVLGGHGVFAQSAKQASVPADEADLLPPDLDATPLPGPHGFTGGVEYLGKANRLISKKLKEDGAEYKMHGRRGGKKYQSFTYTKPGVGEFFRIEDKKGNKVLDWKMEDRIAPILIEDADLFAVPIKIGAPTDMGEPAQVGGLRFYDLQGKLLGQVDPGDTGRIRMLRVNKDGIALVNTSTGKLGAYDRTGKKLFEIAPLPPSPGWSTLPRDVRFSPDGRYFYTGPDSYFEGNQRRSRGSLYDMSGRELVHDDDAWGSGREFVVFSEDSKYLGYKKCDPKLPRCYLQIVDISTREVARVVPGAGSFYVAISEGAAHVAYSWPSTKRTEKGEVHQGEFKVVDSHGRVKGDFNPGDEAGSETRWVRPRFLSSNLVAFDGDDDVTHYFRIVGGK